MTFAAHVKLRLSIGPTGQVRCTTRTALNEDREKPTAIRNESPAATALSQLEVTITQLQSALTTVQLAIEQTTPLALDASTAAADADDHDVISDLVQEMKQTDAETTGLGTRGSGRSSQPRLREPSTTLRLAWRQLVARLDTIEDWIMHYQSRRRSLQLMITARDGNEEEATPALEELAAPILAAINPNADTTQALRRFNDGDDEPPSPSRGPAFSAILDDDLEETHETRSSGPHPSQPLFAATPPADVTRYGATCATLGIEVADTTHLLSVVVDSGAARSCLDYSFLRQHLPALEARIQPSSERFHDASGQEMPVVGCLEVTLRLGQCALRTSVQVFRRLAVPFLLGTNTLSENSLVTNHCSGTLYVDPTAACGLDCSTHLNVSPTVGTYLVSPPMIGGQAPRDEYLTGQASIDFDTDTCQLIAHANCPTNCPPLARLPCHRSALPLADVRTTVPCSTTTWSSPLRASRDYCVKARSHGVGVLLDFDRHHPVAGTTIELSPDAKFLEQHSALSTLDGSLHSCYNFQAFMHITNTGPDDVWIREGTLLAHARERRQRTRAHKCEPMAVQLVLDEASGSQWKRVGPTPPAHCQTLEHPGLSARLSGDRVHISPEELDEFAISPLRMSHTVRGIDGYYCPTEPKLSYAEGGPPTSEADWIDLGLDLTKSIDPDRPLPDGGYEPISACQREQLYAAARRWWWVWSRDARTPNVSRLVVIDIPTGESEPIAQKPYPIPYAYRDAVVDELRKLLEGGLIEASMSQWASPILVRLKKDSTPDKVKLKIIVDYRRLNQVTISDSAGLGDQDELMDSFGGRQRFCGICDAAGGFYQFTINPAHRHRTAFILPTSMGGTSFQWRVAPYGLTRNPAGYSRGMMFALQHMHSIHLAPNGRSLGGCGSWIDDISMHADSFEGFVDLFDRVLGRMAAACMQLKASKCFLLHERLEVLGFFVTPDGIVMQESKLADLEKRDPQGRLVAPSTVDEIRTFLGAVQFYRRFVPRLSLLAAPMNAMLKKGAVYDSKAQAAIDESFGAILTFLKSSAVVSAPDLRDPRAEYVICTDACDIAAGGVLLQWQHPSGRGPPPPPGVPMRGGKDSDPLNQSWRLDCGYQLRTIAYFSKTFDSAQTNYPTFDKESAAILFCVRRWAKIITGRPCTVYTDSSVASSMLHKHLGPPRLQRWGMELGTFLPYLKVSYRRGVDNGMADFLSRYPTFKKYVSVRESPALPAELFDVMPDAVPLFTHLLGDDDGWLSKCKYDLYDAKDPQLIESVWQSGATPSPPPESPSPTAPSSDHDPQSLLGLFPCSWQETARARPDSSHELAAFAMEALQDSDFKHAQHAFDSYCSHWERYTSAFELACGRAPVIYDMCCGEGGFSRGARLAGYQCYGFEILGHHRRRYEFDRGLPGADPAPSSMEFERRDVIDEALWDELERTGKIGDRPPPDYIHVSPPCRGASRLRKVGATTESAPMDICLNWIIRRLKRAEKAFHVHHDRPLLWSVENVPESETLVTESVTKRVRLCGSMMGHRVFRHRTFYCNFEAEDDLPHSHKGQWVGSRGVHYSLADDLLRFGHLPPPNMYGIYSSPGPDRGTLDEWHGAMGFAPNTFTHKGLVGALPISYGRLLASQATAHALHRRFGHPLISPQQSSDPASLSSLSTLAATGGASLPTSNPMAAELHAEVFAVGADLPDATASPAFADEATTPTGDPLYSPYVVTRADQLRDPALHTLVTQLEATRAKPSLALRLSHTMHQGLLWRWGVSADGEPARKLMVPRHAIGALLRQYHFSSHRGHHTLYDQVRGTFYWPSMLQDCLSFVNACTVCGERRSRTLQKAPVVPVPTPSRPFEVIHIDHKGPLRRSGGYTNILVVVCALTRYTLYIPVVGTTGEETVKALMARVFSIFGYPLVMVSDNGPAFINKLQVETAKFFGYRHIPILPYNAQANGTAEASVKRIKLLLDRHLHEYADWHKLLPFAQLQLNSHVHTGTTVSPFMAVFGRQPFGIEHLENPSLLPDAGPGSEWLSSVRARMTRLHRLIQQISDDIKIVRADEANTRRHSEFDSRAGRIVASTPGDPCFVRMIRGSAEDAKYLRKHGHGAPWKHRYKVLEVRPHAVRLEVPKDGSVPIVNEWQLIRRCEPAPSHEESPHPDDPVISPGGLLLPSTGRSPVPPLPEDDTLYEIERILGAERVSGRYKLWVKWADHADATQEWKHDIERQVTHPRILEEIRDAVSRCRDQFNEVRDGVDDPTESQETAASDAYVADDDATVPLPPRPPGAPLAPYRPRRATKPVDRLGSEPVHHVQALPAPLLHACACVGRTMHDIHMPFPVFPSPLCDPE